MNGQTLPEQAYYEKWSIEDIAEEMLKHGTKSPEHQMFSSLLLLRQQEKLILKTGRLVLATWVMAFATWALVIADLMASS